MTIALYHLTCAHIKETRSIAQHLLEKRLVACVKISTVTSAFIWQGAIESSQEILLLLESDASLFDAIEQEGPKHHSCKAFVLTMIKITRASTGVSDWLQESVTPIKAAD